VHARIQVALSSPMGQEPRHVSDRSDHAKLFTYLKVKSTILIRLFADEIRNSMAEYLARIRARSGAVANDDPFVKPTLNPWDSNPPENKAENDCQLVDFGDGM